MIRMILFLLVIYFLALMQQQYEELIIIREKMKRIGDVINIQTNGFEKMQIEEIKKIINE